MAPLREILAELGFDVDLDKIDEADDGLIKIKKSFGAVAALLAGGAVINELAQFVTGMAAIIDTTDKAATSLGLTTRTLFRWRDAVEAVGGQGDQFQGGVKNLSKQLRAAKDGTEGSIKSFKKLGLTLRDIKRLGFEEVLERSVLGLSKVEDAVTRTVIADELFGEAGQSLIRISEQGTQALAQQQAQFDSLNPTLDETIKGAKEVASSFDGFNRVSAGLKRQIAGILFPALTTLVRFTTDVITSFQRLITNTAAVEATFVVLGAVAVGVGVAVTTAFAGPILTVLAVAAAFAATVLIVDDLIVLFRGGKSVTGAFIDSLFGVGAATATVKTLSEVYEGMIEFTFLLIEAFVELGEAIGTSLAKAFLFLDRGATKLTDLVNGLATAIADVARSFEAVFLDTFNRISDAIDSLLSDVRGAIDTVTDLGGDVLDFLGVGDEDDGPDRSTGSPRFVRDIISEAERRASAPGGGNVTVGGPTTVNVEGSGDPEVVADRVVQRLDDVRTRELRQARDLVPGI